MKLIKIGLVFLLLSLLSTAANATSVFRVLEQDYEVWGGVDLIYQPETPPPSYYDDYAIASTDSADGYAVVIGEGFEYSVSNSISELGYASVYTDTSPANYYEPHAQAYATSRVVFSPVYGFDYYVDGPIAFDWDGGGFASSGNLVIRDLFTDTTIFEASEGGPHVMGGLQYLLDYDWVGNRSYEMLIDLEATANTDGVHWINVDTDMFQYEVPEPGSMAVLFTGLMGLAIVRRRAK